MADRLDDAERVAWIRFALVAQGMPAALDAQLVKNSGITHIEYLALTLLAQADDRSLTMSRLAALTGSSLSRLSHVLTRLEGHGFAERRRSETDARVTIASITELGVKTARAAAPGHLRNIRELVFDHISAEQVEQLSQIMQTVLGRLDPAGDVSPMAR